MAGPGSEEGRRPRLLVVNPNTSEAVTSRIAAVAAAAAGGDAEIVARTAPSGVPFLATPADQLLAERAVLEIVQAEAGAAGAVVVAAFSDPGLWPLRREGRLPVTGIGEAGCLTAIQLADRFAVVTLGSGAEPAVRARALAMGLAGRLVSVHGLDATAAGIGTAADSLADVAVAAVHEACRRGAGAVLLGGGPLAGLAVRIAGQVPVPLVDGTVAAVHQALALLAQPRQRSR